MCVWLHSISKFLTFNKDRAMDSERELIFLRFRAVLSSDSSICDRFWFDTSVQKIGLGRYRLYPHTFQLVFTLNEEDKDKDQNNTEQQDDEISSVDSFSATSSSGKTARAFPVGDSTVGDEGSSDLTNNRAIMASQFEEVLAKRKVVQVGSFCVVEDEAILEARTRTFVRWINGHLHSKGIHVKNLDSDLESGVVIIKLLETLAHEKRIPGRLVC